MRDHALHAATAHPSHIFTLLHRASLLVTHLTTRCLQALHVEVLDFAVADADELHAHPAFGFLVWFLFASLMRFARGDSIPPRALAAAQLGLTCIYWSGASRLLPLMLLLAGAYLRGALLASSEARYASRRMGLQRTRRHLGKSAPGRSVAAKIIAGGNL